MRAYSVPSTSFVHLSALAVAVLFETGAHAVFAARLAAAINAASFRTLRMGRIIAHLANGRQHYRTRIWSGPRAIGSSSDKTEGLGGRVTAGNSPARAGR